MKTPISSRGQLVLPRALRGRDGIKAGQEFEVERVRAGEYRLVRRRKRVALERWFAPIAADLTCLPFTSAVAHVWATLLHQLPRRGTAMPVKASLIAATALHHDLTIVTRNTHATFGRQG